MMTIRYSHIYDVLEYYNDQVFSTGVELDQESEVIFQTGFEYLNNTLVHLDLLMSQYFNNDFETFEKNSKAINLLLYAYDFQDEIEDKKALEDLENLTSKILQYIEKSEEIPDELFGILDDITFKALPSEYKGIPDIFYEIAEDLDILDDNGEEYIVGQ